MHHVIEPLRFPYDLRITLEAAFPKLIADHRHRVSVAPRVLAGFESAPKHGMNAHGVKIVGRDDAARGDLGAVANAECSPHDFGDDKRINERATPLQIEQVRPGDAIRARLPDGCSSDGEQLFLVRYSRIRAKQDSFNPTEHSGIGPDPKSQAKNGKKRKAGTAPEHAKAEAKILHDGFDHGKSSLLAVHFLGLLDAPEAAKGFAASVGRGHAFAKV